MVLGKPLPISILISVVENEIRKQKGLLASDTFMKETNTTKYFYVRNLHSHILFVIQKKETIEIIKIVSSFKFDYSTNSPSDIH